MTLLLLGVVLFAGVHFIPAAGNLRGRLVARLGEGPYKGLFSLLSLGALALIIIGKIRAPFVPLWEPPSWGRAAAFVLVLAGFILIAAAYLPSNVKRFTRHPMLWGIVCWAAGHLLANGDVASAVLFGGFGAYSLLAMLAANKRGAALSDRRYPPVRDALPVLAGSVLFAVLLYLHPYFAGVSVLH